MRQVVILAIFVTSSIVGPDLRIHMLTLVLVCKCLLNLLKQHVLVEILWSMHLLLPTDIWTHELCAVVAICIHVLQLIWGKVINGHSVLHKLCLWSQWAVMYKALHPLVP